MQEFVAPCCCKQRWGDITMQIGKCKTLMKLVQLRLTTYFSGYVTLAYLWARMALVAQEKLAEGTTDVDFYNA
jgi:hypothetical protein